MYGQLKSTVTCLTCENVSITFDPFLTLSVPIPKPLNFTVYFMPLNQDTTTCLVLQLPMSNDSTIADLQAQIRLHLQSTHPLQTYGYQPRTGLITHKFTQDQLCEDIDLS